MPPRATTRDCPYESSYYVGAILYGCPAVVLKLPRVLVQDRSNFNTILEIRFFKKIGFLCFYDGIETGAILH